MENNNMGNFFDSVQEHNIPQYNKNNIHQTDFEVPLPPINYKDIINCPSIELTNDIALYEQYPNTSKVEATTDYSIIIPAQQMMIQINILENLLKEDSQNPMILFQLINLYKETKLIDKLNLIRDKTLKLYPLTEQIWIDWIKEKRAQCITIVDHYKLVGIYNDAFKDFPYLNLSLMFIEFLIALSNEEVNENDISGFGCDKITTDYIRNTFRKMIKIWGLDIDLSSIVYDMYIEFESKNNCSRNDMRAIWRERLSIPQTTIDFIWDEYSKWDKDNINEISKSKAIYDLTSNNINYVITVAERFKTLLKDIQNEDGLETFISFLQTEIPTMIKLNKNYIFLFFEKALESSFNESELWKFYLFYATSFNDRSINLDILRRACRCCPGDIMFVILFLREMEINGCSINQIEQKINDSFLLCQIPSFQYEIWKYYLEFKCRNIDIVNDNQNHNKNEIRKLFNKAIRSINDQSEFVDNIYHIWAEFECYKTKDASMLIDIMNHIVIKESTIHNWRAYIYYIKSVGNEIMIREVYKKAFDDCIEEREVLKRNWIAWEKIFGNPKSIDSTVTYTQNIINQLEKELITSNTNNNKIIIPPSSLMIKSKDEKSYRKVFVKNVPFHYNENDLKQFILQHSPLASIEEIRVIRDDNGNSRLFAFIDMTSHDDALALVNDLNNKQIDDKHTITCAISKPPKEGENDLRTLFVNNLLYSTTKEKLKEVFSVYGNILDIRLIINQQTGKPRGYGYIEYQNEESIEIALSEKKPIVIDGREIQIQKSQSVSKIRSKIKYVALITNLDYKIKESQLGEFFIENDSKITKENIIGIKIVKDTEGDSKGFGFVEFDSIQSLTKAIDLNAKYLENRQIFIKEANTNISNSKDKIQSKDAKEQNRKYLQKKTERRDDDKEDNMRKPKQKMKNKDFSKLFN